MQFQIEYIDSGAKPYVVARQIGAGKFMIGPLSKLGAASVTPPLSQPRVLKADGALDVSVFAFLLTSSAESAKLKVGDVVELTNSLGQSKDIAVSGAMNDLLKELKNAHELASQYAGGYSERFSDAEEFADALGKAILDLETGNLAVIDSLSLWFLPTSDWDDLIKLDGLEIGQHVSALLEKYRDNR